jgi:hypothetical protein
MCQLNAAARRQSALWLSGKSILRCCEAICSHRQIPSGGDCPNGQFGSIGGTHFAEDPVQIFLHGPFGKVQLISDFLVELPFTDEIDYLSLSKAEHRAEGPPDVLGSGAVRTDSFADRAAEFYSASIAVSQLIEFNNVCHKFEAPVQFTDLTLRPVLTYWRSHAGVARLRCVISASPSVRSCKCI